MDDRLAGRLLAELNMRVDTADGLASRLRAAGLVAECTAKDLESILRALERDGRVRGVDSAQAAQAAAGP